MYASSQRITDDTAELRRQAGNWHKEQRERVGLTQREMATALAIKKWTFISQLETGACRVPSTRYEDWARILEMPVRDLALSLMPFYDPESYNLLFPGEPDADVEPEHKAPAPKPMPRNEEITDRKAEHRARKELGTWLADRRKLLKMTQVDLAAKLGIPEPIRVSLVENGHDRMPLGYTKAWAWALKISPHYLARALLRVNDPLIFDVIFPDEI
ncbi:helix-turn-helix transcriptional regulator [Alsobacter sp. KACC 23698]|uniref:Helix-turn-helix transcriptional regulator n=1 Tax=Alsobacter sp. KACC 23698 TaxID=3149229 RepID=A0AAU7JMZ3_9HYPH